MKFCVAAVLALSSVVPTYSFSYLDQLGGASPVVASTVNIAPPVPVAATVVEPPFFFTNGASDAVAADSPAFFFTSGSTDLPTETATSAGSYLDVLGNDATSASGPGMANYLDALPQNNASGGPGISTYASSLNQAASEVYMATAPAAAPTFAASPAAAEVSHPIPDLTAVAAAAAPSAGSYLDALATGSSSSGAGITTYLETLPQTCILSGGAGMSTYASNLVSANVVSGAGVPTYTDVLGGGLSSYTNSFSPFGAASISSSGSSQSNFAIGSVTGRFDFTLEADAAMIAQLQAAGNRRVTIKGKMKLL